MKEKVSLIRRRNTQTMHDLLVDRQWQFITKNSTVAVSRSCITSCFVRLSLQGNYQYLVSNKQWLRVASSNQLANLNAFGEILI